MKFNVTKLCLILLLFLTSACAGQKLVSDNKNIDFSNLGQSSKYLLLAEYTKIENNIDETLLLYNYAELNDSENIYIKERKMIFLKHLSVNVDQKFVEAIAKYGNKCVASQKYNENILNFTIESQWNSLDTSYLNKLFELLMQEKPTQNDYLNYYSFQTKNYEKPDKKLLDKALKLPWESSRSILTIAELISLDNSKRAAELIEKSYDKWHDQLSLQSLLRIYEIKKEHTKSVKIIRERIENGDETSDQIIKKYFEKLFIQGEYLEIIRNQKLCFDRNIPSILFILFESARLEKEFQLCIKAGEAIDQLLFFYNNDINSDAFYSQFADFYFMQKDYDKFVHYIIKVTSLREAFDIVGKHTNKAIDENDLETQQIIRNILAQISLKSDNIELANAVTGICYALLDDLELSTEKLNKVSDEYISQHTNLSELFASIYINNFKNIEHAKKLLDLKKDKKISTRHFILITLYRMGDHDFMLQATLNEMSSQDSISIDEISMAGMIFEKVDRIDLLILHLEKALETYPANPSLLNFLGYSIAKHKIEEKYDFAEQLLTKALDIEPQTVGIWDSLAWLYYQKGNYKSALKVMKPFLTEQIDNSEIAYHLGKIYFKMNKIKNAKKYLQLAISINNDVIYVDFSKKLLSQMKK
ncbi:MAG: hypothetical protein K8S23_10250 [Candidatus Cloacimonetes bacterium]|nr:hypothetical protein [Candidatus Cloacimonadota bacterium]